MSEVTVVLGSPKIGPVHLGRDAYVYVRQSTLTQLRDHTESLLRQYELRERAVALGWDAHQVRVIDADLGRSGAEATARQGFKDLVAEMVAADREALRLGSRFGPTERLGSALDGRA